MALLAYNRKKQFLAPDVEGLIKHLTGFEENHKNFEEIAKFVYSNIIHHNFATVDISTVKRSVDGIAEKFMIHGLDQRGNRLRELVERYVSSDPTQQTQLIAKWNVMLLLLKLSYHPTSVTEDALKIKQDVSEPSQQEEAINWSEYLKEGWEEFQHDDESSEEDVRWASSSEDEGVEELPAYSHVYQHVTRTDCGDRLETEGFGEVPHPSQWVLQPPPPTREEAIRTIQFEAARSEQWLLEHVQNTRRESSCNRVSESKFPQAHVCEIWKRCMEAKQVGDSSPLPHIHVVSEYKVLQEVLWMLQVPTDTSLFYLNNEGLFEVRPNVSLASTVPGTLQLVLQGLCPYFNMVHKLRKFEKELSEQEMSEKPPPVTYKAYSAALFQELSKFNRIIITIETKLNKLEETMTLVTVMDDLSTGLNILRYLYDIHVRAVTDWVTERPWVCATRLLSVWYEALLEASDQKYLESSLNIFLHSFHVYLNIIDVWLSEGRLEDWRQEFLVIRKTGNLTVMPYEETMRKCGVVPVSLLSKLVRVVRDAGRIMEVVSQLNKLAELRGTVQNKGCLFKEFSENVFNEIKRLKEIIHVGKPVIEESSANTSVVTSDKRDTSDDPRDTGDDSRRDTSDDPRDTGDDPRDTGDDSRRDTSDDPRETEVDLTETDLEVHNLLSGENAILGNNKSMVERENQQSVNADRPIYMLAISNKYIYNHMMNVALANPLLSAAFKSYFQTDCPVSPEQSRPPTPQEEQPVQNMSLVGLMSMHSVLERQLDLVIKRYRIASDLVTTTLRSEYSLLQHFTILRNVFFMEAGNLAQRFYSYLFTEIESGAWNNSLDLSVQLQTCVDEFYPGFGNLFSVIIASGDLTDSVHKAIPTISLAYRVDWPISMVVTQDMIDSYNKVFRFLLYLKYAFWTLHNMRFSDLYDSQNTLRVRQLQVLKLWMYHSTNTLHAYFMGQVLRSFSTHLEKSIQQADSIDIIIQAHNKFLDEVKMHCLQDKRTHIETFIMKLLRLCSTLADKWVQESADLLTDAEVHSLLEKYTIAYRGLVHCLEVVTAETDAESFLFELKSELAHSIPEPWYIQSN